MKVYVNDKPIKFIPYQGEHLASEYDTVLSGEIELISKSLIGRVLITNATTRQIERFIQLSEVKKLKHLQQLTFACVEYEIAIEFFKDIFKVIKAAGGVVRKGNAVLMMYRLEHWDLPKGKLKKKENPEAGALREVEEECSIKVELNEHLCTTWHTYTRKNTRMLKRTDWYTMACLDDSEMRPQIEEFIEELRWMEWPEVEKSLAKTYHSIHDVLDQYKRVELDFVR
jgi:ADP-ribose pyrophosphatase YjhB (NUDIX family)